jgi:hypothetical protein
MTQFATITDEQILTLRAEALNAGDLAQAALCTLAFDGAGGLDADDRAALLSIDVDPDDTHPTMARALCGYTIRVLAALR